MKNDLYSNCLREDLRLWKKEVGASYDDIADILKCSKSHIYEFLKRKKSLSYELGKNIECVITTWTEQYFVVYKTQKRLLKKKENEE